MIKGKWVQQGAPNACCCKAGSFYMSAGPLKAKKCLPDHCDGVGEPLSTDTQKSFVRQLAKGMWEGEAGLKKMLQTYFTHWGSDVLAKLNDLVLSHAVYPALQTLADIKESFTNAFEEIKDWAQEKHKAFIGALKNAKAKLLGDLKARLGKERLRMITDAKDALQQAGTGITAKATSAREETEQHLLDLKTQAQAIWAHTVDTLPPNIWKKHQDEYVQTLMKLGEMSQELHREGPADGIEAEGDKLDAVAVQPMDGYADLEREMDDHVHAATKAQADEAARHELMDRELDDILKSAAAE